MVCPHCQAEVADGVRSCWKCGHLLRKSESGGGVWELCTIVHKSQVMDDVLMAKHHFVAQAVGLRGPFTTGESASWFAPGTLVRHSDEKAVSAHHGLMETLIKDGWEYAGRGSQWYGIQLRRKAK